MRLPRFSSLLCLALLAACSKQGEGERCDLNSGNLDCDTGLICRSAEQLSITGGRGVALCCPQDGVEPSVDACRAGANLPPEVVVDGGLGANLPPDPASDAGGAP